MSHSESDNPLEGIRVLDLTRLLPGPLCTLHMADLGADVIKIEDPAGGDYARWIPPLKKKQSLAFLGLNRNKRSMTLNLKKEKARDIFRELIKETDVVIESFRPGVMESLSLSYEELKKIKSDLVYCSLTGYGQSGPYKDHPGHDINYLGFAGILHQMGHKGETPSLSNLQIADTAGGSLTALSAILAALFKAKMQGKGRYIDSSMLDGTLSLNQVALAGLLNSPKNPPAREEEFLNGGSPCYQIYKTKDQKYMALGAMEKKFWVNFCQTIERDDLIDQHMLLGEESKSLFEELKKIFKQRTRAEWTALFESVEACCTPVLSLDETLENPQIESREMLTTYNHPEEGELTQWASPFKMSDFHFENPRPAPFLGENTHEILKEKSFSKEEIEELKSGGII